MVSTGTRFSFVQNISVTGFGCCCYTIIDIYLFIFQCIMTMSEAPMFRQEHSRDEI
jgi:hypothetical protein